MELFDSGLKYCGINTARSALSSLVDDIIGCSVGNLPLVKRLLKGTYHLSPNEPRYQFTWDVKFVLDYLEALTPKLTISLREVTLKLTMLMVLLYAQRAQTFSMLDISRMYLEDEKICI